MTEQDKDLHQERKYLGNTSPGIAVSDAEISSILKVLKYYQQNYIVSYDKLIDVEQSIVHRCWLTNCHTAEDYLQLLSDSTVEKDKLYNHLISTTTCFFRDRTCWEWLATEIIPQLLIRLTPKKELRCWVVGCATGEEAYSLAILLKEQIAAICPEQKFKILATDINTAALKIARVGIYRQNIAEHISPKRLKQNFSFQNGFFEANYELRQKVIFATHNIVTDIGYPQLDLICCRNLLMYLHSQHQHRVLLSLQNSLKSEGILFVGKYELIPSTFRGFDQLLGKEEFLQKKNQIDISPQAQTCSIESEKPIVQLDSVRNLGDLVKCPDLVAENNCIQNLNSELANTKENLQIAIEELSRQQLVIETINQELKIANETANILNQKHQGQVKQLEKFNLDLETLLQSIEIGVIFLDRQLNIRKYNSPAQKIFRFKTVDLARPIKDIQHNLDRVNIMGILEEFIQTKVFKPLEVRNLATGEFLIMNLHASGLGSSSIEGVVLTFVDISDRKQAEKVLENQAFYDSLTRLPNRLLFKEQLLQAIARLPRQNSPFLVVLYLDLNGFKEVNDSLGHATGDLLLIEVARRLTEIKRSNDIICRLGGDEFAILLEEIDNSEQSIAFANRIHQALSIPFLLKHHRVTISTSIGITFCDAGDEVNDNIETLMDNADIAMYRAKNKGAAQTEIFQPHMRAKAEATIKMKNQIRQAISGEEFLLQYQPIYDLSNEKFKGFEALLRWNHPELGLIYPEQFLPVIEKNSSLFFQLECLIIKQMHAQLQYWSQEFQLSESFSLNVNISPQMITHDDFLSYFQTIINSGHEETQYLTIELTESALIDNPKKVEKTLELLRLRGIKIALDDFGTGFSSLSYLHSFPLDIIKLDRSFLRSLDDHNRSSHIVRSIIYLSQQLNLIIVAEGIENIDQLLWLQKHGCHLGQGYFWHPALAADAATELIASQSN